VTAKVIQLERTRGRGRQPFDVEERRILREELSALIAEGHELATLLIHVARRAQVLLDELERLGLRHQARMTAAAAEWHSDTACPDGVDAMGHGAAA
jgi:hypothetical protein